MNIRFDSVKAAWRSPAVAAVVGLLLTWTLGVRPGWCQSPEKIEEWKSLRCDELWAKVHAAPNLTWEQKDKMTPEQRKELFKKYPPFTQGEFQNFQICLDLAPPGFKAPDMPPGPYRAPDQIIEMSPMPPPQSTPTPADPPIGPNARRGYATTPATSR